MFRRPALGLAEIAWRWSFGMAATALIGFCFLEYLDTLPVSRADMFLLRTRQPTLVSQALAHILRGSVPRLVLAMIVLATLLGVAWMVMASLGRAATMHEMFGYFRAQAWAVDSPAIKTLHFGSLAGLNFLRVGAALAAGVGCAGAFVLGGMASSEKNPSPGSAFLIAMMVLMLVGLAWAGLNWFLSLASLFVPQGRNTMSAMLGAVDLCRTRAGPVLAAGAWFGLAHLVVFFVATSVVAFPLAFAGVLPAGVVLGGVLLVTLLYFAIVDYLYVGRLAAYVAILQMPAPAPATVPVAAVRPSAPAMVAPLATNIDKDEPILSDHSARFFAATPNSVDKAENILGDAPPRHSEEPAD